MEFGPKLTAIIAVEIRKSVCPYVLAVTVEQSRARCTRPLNRIVQMPNISEESFIRRGQCFWAYVYLFAITISTCCGRLEVPTPSVDKVVKRFRRDFEEDALWSYALQDSHQFSDVGKARFIVNCPDQRDTLHYPPL